LAQFKIIANDAASGFASDVDKLRREAAETGPHQLRTFEVDISAYEYCDEFDEVEVGSYLVRAYTPAMIAIEKYRAVCQQNAGYSLRPHKAPRARDFVDIRSIIEERGVDMSTADNRELFRRVFASKDVPLSLLQRIPGDREFHRADWPAVIQTVHGRALTEADFDTYFDFALGRIPEL
jgi:hypothetical protein